MTRTFLAVMSVVGCCAAAPPVLADIINVPADQPTIQAGIDAAVDGDEVVVADGTYTGDGNRDMDFGGKAITVRSENGAAACIIDLQADENDPHRAFTFTNGETPESVVEGFTIQNGFMDEGGAVLCVLYWAEEPLGSNPSFQACVFQQNTASTWGGGAVSCLASTPTFTDCQFLENHVEVNNSYVGGGAIYYSAGCGKAPYCISPIVLSGCLFSGNTATGKEHESWGGAMYIRVGHADLTGCAFEGNQADLGGAMGFRGYATATLYECTFLNNVALINGGALNKAAGLGQAGGVSVVGCLFMGNHAVGSGGGLYLAFFTVINSTFSRNTASTGGGIYAGFNGGSGGIVDNSILWENTPDAIAFNNIMPSVSYSGIQGGWEGAGNIDADPRFVDPDNGDFRLSAGSPCIDAANNTAVPKGLTTDLDSNPRFIEDPNTLDTGLGDCPIVDMGSYEFQEGTEDCCPADFDNSGDVGVKDLLFLLGAWGPCPPKGDCLADFDDSGDVGVKDLLVLLGNWGPCP